MIEKSLDLIYNKKYLVIVPFMSKELLEAFNYTFKNVILMNNNLDDVDFMREFINRNNFKKLIFVDYQVEYVQLIDSLQKEPEMDFIFTKSLGSLTDRFIYDIFLQIRELAKKYEGTIGLLDRGLYETLKKKDKVKYLLLDVEKEENAKLEVEEKTVGLLNNQEDPKHSFYNELSAIKLLDDEIKAKIYNPSKTTKKFLRTFNVNYETVSNSNDLYDNKINLYINFAANNKTVFLKSMDKGIPCLIGNMEILDDYKCLKEMLVVKSDDSIDYIALKIKEALKNRDKILKEYLKFRKDYVKKSKESVEEFLGLREETKKSDNKDELLMTVVVPVYNTEKYLAKSLDSIINASVKDMEILVINDGSTDNSEKIILEYLEKYKDLIRYIKQENHGLGNVRNVGLKEAKGKYIASIDSDDTINIDFFTKALPYLEKDVDIVMCDWLTVTDDNKYETAAIDYVFNDINRYEGLLYTTIMPSTCNKIIKKSLYQDLAITYIEDKFEDLSTNPFIMLKAETIKYINKPYYEYYIRSNSINRTKPGFSMIDILKKVSERLEKYEDYLNVSKDKFKYYTYSWRIEDYIINQLYTVSDEFIDEYVNYIYKNLKDIVLDIFNNDLYKQRIESLHDQDLKNYIIKRNKAFEKGDLVKFIKKARKSDNYHKLTPPIIYYGD